MADQTTKKLLDREELRHAIQEEYEEVALNPEKGFHFHTGRRLAGMLGYDETWLQSIPQQKNPVLYFTPDSPNVFGHIKFSF